MPLHPRPKRRADRTLFRAMLVVLALVPSACRKTPALPEGSRITVMTALPLFGTNADPGVVLNGPDQRAEIIRILSARYEVVPLARLDRNLLADSILIMAQPRALAGEELVAVDAWVRSGGKVLVFIDPELFWPSELPLGDPRRPPPIGLLDPLLSHWGLVLVSPAITDSGPEGAIAIGQSSVAVAWAGRWQTRDRRCKVESDGFIADCGVGKGRALLVADADLLDQRLWRESGMDNESAILGLIDRVAAAR